ncbi:MAG: SpoIIE family protein phosphatase [Leptonema sp. (in: Bacteria)]|nr:SpoIIE family protein phosphatase [Leptonema sp. (in: bacteria)]
MKHVLQKASGRLVAIDSDHNVKRLIRLILQEATRITGAEAGIFYRYRSDGRMVASVYPQVEDLVIQSESSDQPPQCHILARMALKQQSSEVYRQGVTLSEGFSIERATATILLTIPEGDIGVIVLQKPKNVEHFYDNEFYLARSLLASFSLLLRSALIVEDRLYLKIENNLMMLLENTFLNQRSRESDSRFKAVLEVSNVINSSRQLDEMIEAVLYSAVHVIRAESASLFLIDETTGEMVFDVITGNQKLKGIRVPQGQGIVGLCAREKRPILVNDAVNDSRVYRSVDEVSQMTTRNLLACPLLIESECIGVIEVVNTLGRADFSPADLEIFMSFSDSVAIAVQRRRLIDNIESANRELERSLRENKCLHRVTASVVEANTIDELFNETLSVITDELGIRRASIMLADETNNQLSIRSSIGLPVIDDSEFDAQIAKYFLKKREPAHIHDIAEEPELHRLTKNDRYHSGECIIVPLIQSQESPPFGLFSASEPVGGKFHPDDFRIVITAVAQIVKGYVNFKLSEELLDKQAIEKELEITSRIQRDILPATMPKNPNIEVAARSIMAKTMGGDFYDFYQEDDQSKLTALVADVSGKSLPAALFMAVSSSILRTTIRTENKPDSILRRANDLLYEESESGMFVTVFLSQFDFKNSLLHYASAGHNEMLLLHQDDSYDVLKSRGAPLGVIESTEHSYEGKTTHISDGDLLVLYTDGVVEEINTENQEFGLDRFVEVLIKIKERPLAEIIDQVFQETQKFAGGNPQYDDFTLVLIRYNWQLQDLKSVSEQEVKLTFSAELKSVPALIDAIDSQIKEWQIADDDINDILLAADEVATNIIMYSFKELNHIVDPHFQCVLKATDDEISLLFVDGGHEYDFEGAEKPDVIESLSGSRLGGYGIFLVRSLMDKTEYLRKSGMNYLFLSKKRKKGIELTDSI